MTLSTVRLTGRTALVRALVTGIVGIALWSGTAAGHKVNVFAQVEGDEVVVEGYFSGKVKATDCLVEVFDAEGSKLGEARTDAQGICRFPVSALGTRQSNLTVILRAGMGHKAEYVLRAADLGVASPAAKDRESTQETLEQPQPSGRALLKPAAASSSPSTALSAQCIDAASLTKAIEDAVDRKLEPVVRMLGQQQKVLVEQKDRGPTMSEIVGGIGWIVGIVGIAAYLAARKRKCS